MFDTVDRIFKNIKWLFNHPCTNICDDTEDRECDYCYGNNGTFHHRNNGMTICCECLKKVFDKVLTNS